MKNIIKLSVISLLCILGVVCAIQTEAKVYTTVSAGYLFNETDKKHRVLDSEENGIGAIAIGYSGVLQNTNVQLEYYKSHGQINTAAIWQDVKQHDLNIIGIIPVANVANGFDLYGLGGIGYTYLTGASETESSNAIIGGGLEYYTTPKVSLVTEVRTNYNIPKNYWQQVFLVGLKFNLGK